MEWLQLKNRIEDKYHQFYFLYRNQSISLKNNSPSYQEKLNYVID